MEEQKPPENRSINTKTDNYNERIEGDYIQGNVFQNIFNILGGQTTTPVGDPARPKNERILLAAVKEEVTARLKQSLHNAVLINLGKESQPQQVKRPWDAEIKIGLKPAELLPDTTTILQVFESTEIAGKLLILGAPGSGKTTTQLELAQALISHAEEQPDYPVPVLLNLSSWKDNRQPIAEWLVVNLKSKYGVSTKLGKDWLENRQLLLMLDGLDEILSVRLQTLCIKLINQFLSIYQPLYFVVCSRTQNYTNELTKINLNGAVCLRPLSYTQIRNYLSSNDSDLWQAISDNTALMEFIKTPSMLSLTILAFQEMSFKEKRELVSTTNSFQYLIAAYMHRMLLRDINSRVYRKYKFPSSRKTQLWLAWLAQMMTTKSQTIFLIEEIQPNWLINSKQKLMYYCGIVLISLLIGTSIGVPFCLLVNPLAGLCSGLILGLSLLLLAALNQKVQPVESLQWRWQKVKGELGVWLRPLLLIGPVLSLIARLTHNNNFILVLLGVMVVAMAQALSTGLSNPDVIVKTIPNEGIQKSAINCVFLALLGGIVTGVWASLIYRINNGLGNSSLIISLLIGLFVGFWFGLKYGGVACIQHFTLRLVLYFNGVIPWNYARFLDYATERLLLQKVGGGYIFIHHMLLEYLAQKS